MKKFLFLLSLMMQCFVSYAQEAEDSGVKPNKFASWTISEPFQAEAGFVGSYWKPKFNIALDKIGYYCVVNLYSSDGYISVSDQALPHLYLKTDNAEVVDLQMDPEEPIHNVYLAGYYSGGAWHPGRYVTRLIYLIPNIDKFLANHFVKYRVWIGESYKDVEMTKSYAKKFNNRLKEAAKEVTQKYNEKQNTLDNPLEGF